MTNRPIFHLSIPVSDLVAAKRFYVGVLAARVGRESDRWLDIFLWGHQVTLQCRPTEVLPPGQQGKRHFGVVLSWAEWEQEVERVRATGAAFLAEPAVLHRGTAEEQAKFYLSDPSHNVIEIKAYRDVGHTLRLSPAQA